MCADYAITSTMYITMHLLLQTMFERELSGNQSRNEPYDDNHQRMKIEKIDNGLRRSGEKPILFTIHRYGNLPKTVPKVCIQYENIWFKNNSVGTK
jgi:hypothetical protein